MGGEEKWCVVTGGRGFAARHLVVMLIRYGMYSVRIADLGPSIELDGDEENGVLGEALKSGRADYVSVDLRNKAQAFKGWLFRHQLVNLEFILCSSLCFCWSGLV